MRRLPLSKSRRRSTSAPATGTVNRRNLSKPTTRDVAGNVQKPCASEFCASRRKPACLFSDDAIIDPDAGIQQCVTWVPHAVITMPHYASDRPADTVEFPTPASPPVPLKIPFVAQRVRNRPLFATMTPNHRCHAGSWRSADTSVWPASAPSMFSVQ